MKKWLATQFLKLTGWKKSGPRPDTDRAVVIAAPHTSNWDLLYMLAFAAVYDMDIRWMGKHVLFYPPMGWLMRAVGGMPVVRHRSGNVVAGLVQAFSENEKLLLMVPTEGTRARAEHWKSGFYHIANQADVAIVPSFLDWSTKSAGFGTPLKTTGDIGKDMDYFRNYYANVLGKFPELMAPIRLKDEAAP
jgi:1-acyl-sn-glycerol-3-phosphate acyltransferase